MLWIGKKKKSAVSKAGQYVFLLTLWCQVKYYLNKQVYMIRFFSMGGVICF